LDVETYPTVHQLVSEVSGTLRSGTTIGGLLDAAFPAGSMTGAPKASAMDILAGLEGAPRGVYSGTFGWVGDDGAADL
ncbi:chorismate-binding protein, partial [Vibrio parahaemolyticus]